MSGMRRQMAVGMAAILAAVLGGASLAWACGPGPQIDTRTGTVGTSRSSGPTGEPVTINARDFAPSPVEIRWDAVTGTLLGTAQGPNFSITVTIPQAEPGVHYLTAVQYAPSGAVQGQARAAYEVTSRTEEATGATETAAGTGSGGTRSAAADGGDGGEAPAPARNESASAQQSSSSANTASATPAGSGAAPVASSGAASPAPAAAQPAAETARLRQVVPASAHAPAVTTGGGKVVFGNSLPPVATPEPGADVAITPATNAPGSAVAEVATTPTTAGPRLGAALASARNVVGGFSFAAGLVLLAVGAAVLLAHVAFNGARRRVAAGSW